MNAAGPCVVDAPGGKGYAGAWAACFMTPASVP